MGPTNYPTLKAAVDAIMPVHIQCDIIIDICFQYKEGATPATLNAAAQRRFYTPVLIRPVTMESRYLGSSQRSRCGSTERGQQCDDRRDNPNTPGINRNLTIQIPPPHDYPWSSGYGLLWHKRQQPRR